MGNTYKVVLVNYLNAKPFLRGLSQEDSASLFDVSTRNPAQCAEEFSCGNADIALLPVGALPDLQDYEMVTDYCIGCDGRVRTVGLYSQKPVQQCRKLILDNHSRTSFLLSKIILEEFFRVHLPSMSTDIGAYAPKEDDVVLMIGDKVFQHEDKYPYQVDLGLAWKEWTGLPFVFAVWIAKKGINPSVIQSLNSALRAGVESLDEIIRKESHDNLDLFYYYTHNIQYHLDAPKREALDLFLKKAAPHLTR